MRLCVHHERTTATPPTPESAPMLTGAGYLPVLPSFRRLLPGIRPVTLTASVVFVLPVLRDILAWLGLRVVTRRSFLRALRERGSVLLVPGGQAELVHTHRIFTAREYCVYRSHKGDALWGGPVPRCRCLCHSHAMPGSAPSQRPARPPNSTPAHTRMQAS